MLVPEIALTPQTVGRFQARFGDTVALLHSALGEGERYDEWRRLRTRRGADRRRSALGRVRARGRPRPVVIDEEHEASYKHEGDPRYDARRVAAERVRRAGAGLLAGSATPRPETWHGCSASRCRRASTPGRCRPCACSTCAARVTRCTRRRGARSPTPRKSIVLLNRRGWSNFLTCRHCGKVWECPHCDVALVLHRAQGALACHHCGHREPSRAAATPAARWRSRATAAAPSGSSKSCARRSTCPCSGSTPTRPPPRTPSGRSWPASRRRRPVC